MRPLTAGWIADAVGGALHADAHVTVSSAWNDTRVLKPGALYLAVVGEIFDGHLFVDDATEAGAVLTLASRPVDVPHILVDDVPAAAGRLAKAYLALLRSEGELTVIGITGSNGKTTTKDLLLQVLPNVHGPIKSYNDALGVPLTILGTEASTRFLVLEMGASAPGDLAYLTDIAPLDLAVVLTVGTAHLGGYGSPEALAKEKASILDGLQPGGVAILNADDARVAAMAPHHEDVDEAIAQQPSYGMILFGVSEGAANRAHGLTNERGRASFAIGALPRRTLALVGEHHVTNVLAAFSVAVQCGLDPAIAWETLAAAKPLSSHRMALTQRADGVWILDDAYNASPESMRAALRALKDVAQDGRAIAVIGEMREMGELSRPAHEEIGLDAVRLRLDLLLVVGEGARPAYVSAVREGSWGDEAAYAATIDEAREMLDRILRPGDTVLLKSSRDSGLLKLADALLEENA
ncbi:UDP-N-acetylmuramoyl-tripeptide--D-alanyl-D-alanine ligase [Demequina capsici]|uniref:UDP-N-acetylmuramoyl-tripeptide--D-alanyl-D-alanine ligase n=1 Tax=Demequina capsici TaxID=3075620 RepID=A0AA96FAL7_9MICO|nr:UDP-N-acetylmuramoyl-tripeptide--D-alanyl-D-alanine ligase [Demequina sp. PMTSA13]WNM26228.1 UDP-N-acetylmuramoyl-tripeptide--D-alanyl-D-alanine ligase [Demequina sp. PMTSA13]